MRLIDADELDFGKYEGIPLIEDKLVRLNDVTKELKSAPTIDAVPVVHGRWEFPIFEDEEDGLDPRVKCSECGCIEAALAKWNYCPNCGAKMDAEG